METSLSVLAIHKAFFVPSMDGPKANKRDVCCAASKVTGDLKFRVLRRTHAFTSTIRREVGIETSLIRVVRT